MAQRVAFTDALVLVATAAASIALKFGVEIESVANAPFGMTYPALAALIGVAWWLTLAGFHTRDPRILGEDVIEFRRIVRATVMMFGCLAIVSVLFRWEVSRGFLAVTFPLGLVGLLAGRKWWRIWLRRQRRRGFSVSRVLVIGGPEAAARLARKFNGSPETGTRVCGVWVPDENHLVATSLDMSSQRIPLMGSDHKVLEAIAVAHADTVIVTDSEHLGPDGMRELTWDLAGVDVDLMVSPNLVDISAPRMQLGRIADEPFIHLQEPQYAEAGNALKGFFDASVGTFVLLLAAPIICVAAAAVKLTSRGPAFYFQERVGRNGHPFRMIKLRSMRTDADQDLADLLKKQGKDGVPLFKLDDDPRITPVGKFLRRYSIDELPQLWNVIKGDMSLVGPRPQRAPEVSLYDHRAERRLTVRPGMTGLWQVSGRSDLGWEQAIRLDLYYVENWSMTGDLTILWRTLRAVLASGGAR